MVDVVFENDDLTPISPTKDGAFVTFLVSRGLVKSAAGARVILILVGLICFSIAAALFFRNVNEPPLNTQKVIPPGFQSQV